LVNPQVAVIGPDNGSQQQQQNNADGRTKRPVQGAYDPAEYKVRDHFIARTSQDHGGQVCARGKDKNKQTSGAYPWKAQGQGHFPEGLPFVAAHAPGCFQEIFVDSFQTDKYIQNHEGQEELDKAHEHGRLIVKQGQGLGYDPDFHEQVIQKACCSKDVNPAHGPDDETDPERQQNKKYQGLPEPGRAAVEKIGRNIPHDQTEKDTGQRNSDSPKEYARVKKIFKEFGVIAKLKSRYDRTGWRPQPEAVYHDKNNRNDQQQKNGAQGWG